MRRLKLGENEYIDEQIVNDFAISIYPLMLKCYQSEEGQRMYRDWLAAKEERDRAEQKRKQRRNQPER